MDPKAIQFNEFAYLLHKKKFAEAEKLFLENPYFLHYADSGKRMVVHHAASTGYFELVRRQLEAKPELAHSEDDTGWTPFLLASSAGHLEIVRLLLDFKIDINHRIDTGQSALNFACSKNHKAIAQLLINNGADLNLQDERGSTALHKAAAQGHQPIVNLLLCYRKNLQIDLPNREGDTALHMACEDEQMDVALLLVRSGASIEKKNRQNQTPIDLIKGMDQKLKLVKASESVKPTAGT